MTTQDPGLDVAALRALLDRKPLLTRTEALPLLDRLEAAEEALARVRALADEWETALERHRAKRVEMAHDDTEPLFDKGIRTGAIGASGMAVNELRAAIEGPQP